VVWKGWATDEATWEPAAHIHPDLLAEYEAGLDAEAELEAEEERELAEEEAAVGRRNGLFRVRTRGALSVDDPTSHVPRVSGGGPRCECYAEIV
jgi:hypothetical protein